MLSLGWAAKTKRSTYSTPAIHQKTRIIHKYTQRLDHHDFSQLKRNPIGLEPLSGVCSPLTRTLTAVWSCASEPGVSFHMDKSGCNGENLSHVARRAKKGWGPCPGQKPSATIDQKRDSNMCPPSFTETMNTATRAQNKALQIGFWTFYLTWTLIIGTISVNDVPAVYCANVQSYVSKIPKTTFTPGIKGIVRPKMKILSLITHPHVIPNPQDLHSSSDHKLRYF